ncbi:MAG: DNA polymerase III subunit gamma/tau [Candidatus Gracilibacteria bacterium]|nr:DNA polymerase III subunit gamma/tau [Candidatus Gracilibacteria bacterium]
MSLYLKYRPSDFDNLVGQDFIKDTLRKAVANEKTVGAYLLCGPRGTGKTTTARLLAKTINCLNPHDGNPCLECEICRDFSNESLVDIIEIDAASHTGVDNIRELIERAQFLPTKTRYKIYIIDEVHMLSKGAFNALLKILEEPPSHVKFILATTETHKVPETIISRCQRYDFKRISQSDLKYRLSYIAEKEGIEIDDESYDYIIKNSNGGLRNAISLFEQLITDKKISYQDIVSKLGIISSEEISLFLDKLLLKDPSVIEIFDKIIQDGKNIKLFFKELIFTAKNIAINRLKTGESIENYIFILDILDDYYSKTKNSLDENTTFTIAILKIIGKYENTAKNENFTPKNIVKDNNKESKNIPIVQKIDEETEIRISKNDIEDIFDFEQKEEKSQTNNLTFDINLFIDNLKKIGAKGGLITATKSSNISFDNLCLTIKNSNNIYKKSMDNVENFNLMLEALGLMGFSDIKIKII